MSTKTTSKPSVENPVLENEEATSNGSNGSYLLGSRKPQVDLGHVAARDLHSSSQVVLRAGGKGAQCVKVVESFGFEHLSAGDSLRAEINSGSENGTMIQNMIKDGSIMPSEATVKLIQTAMEQSKTNKFLIDGFPRSEENRATLACHACHVFADQSYWQGAIAANPRASYKGYFLGSLLWLPIPFALATALGLSVRALDLPLTTAEANSGLVPMAAAQYVLGKGAVISNRNLGALEMK